ncbi:PepSY domain-containing protein [Nioella sp.]|uniref:PepSY domain-containing protein n=1 Tax=Nioella sp. TaxID=1912091 RepID=UPI003A87FA84
MKKTLTILGFLAVLPASVALADDDCFVPMAEWQPRDAVARLAEENGWTVRRIKIDDGCYEIDGRDAEGRPIEVTVHPATLEVIEFEYEEEDERDDREGDDDDD